MSLIPNGLAKSAAAGFYDHPIEQSLRFNDDDSAYLSRTPASAGNRKTWTWSGWVKRGNLGGTMRMFHAYTSGNRSEWVLAGDTARFSLGGSSSYSLTTTQVFRDTSSWYHIVWSVDTTQATNSDRAKVYINGQQVTDFSTESYPTQNYESQINSAIQHEISSYDGSGHFFDGYLSEVHFIDGTALDATDFGEFKSGVWIPKAYSGFYGTNGFYLDFGNSGSIGADVSGNGNDWTANNLAATDVVLDSPTNNFATLNPLANDGSTLSEGNTRAVTPTTGGGLVLATFGQSSGKYYWEVCPTSVGTALIGVVDDTFEVDGGFVGYLIGDGAKSIAYYYSGSKYIDSTGTSYGSSYTSGDIIGVALNLDDEEITFYKNGVSQGVISSTFVNAMLPAISDGSNVSAGSSTLIVNFGQDSSFAGNKTAQGNTDDNGYGDFYYAPPTGYLALCTANLTVPDAMNPALDNSPQDYFNTVLYTGNGSTQSITGVGFQPDWTWIKSRSFSNNHHLFDSVRGHSKILRSSTTDAESTLGVMTSFDSDGFTVVETGGNNATNDSGSTFAAWNWKANGTGVSNTDGSITSTVSANTDAGFSIVSYSGNSTAGATVGHGLSSAPEMVIVKKRNGADPWQTYSATLGGTKRLELDSTSAAITSTFSWNNTDPTSTVFTLGSGGYGNASGYDYIAYCFHSVEGYSKFGSYTGNGSTDGTFVYTGFRPALIIMKRTDSSSGGYWVLHDSKRDEYNPADRELFPNDSLAEYKDSTREIDLVSNGFKFRDSEYCNRTGGSYIYMAFAENPFKYANAR